MWLTPAARRDVASAIIELLPEWPAPDMLTERVRALIIAWDRGKEIVGAVVGEQMISVFWGGYQESTETPDSAAEMISAHIDMMRGQIPAENQMIQYVPSTWSRWDKKANSKREDE